MDNIINSGILILLYDTYTLYEYVHAVQCSSIYQLSISKLFEQSLWGVSWGCILKLEIRYRENENNYAVGMDNKLKLSPTSFNNLYWSLSVAESIYVLVGGNRSTWKHPTCLIWRPLFISLHVIRMYINAIYEYINSGLG